MEENEDRYKQPPKILMKDWELRKGDRYCEAVWEKRAQKGRAKGLYYGHPSMAVADQYEEYFARLADQKLIVAVIFDASNGHVRGSGVIGMITRIGSDRVSVMDKNGHPHEIRYCYVDRIYIEGPWTPKWSQWIKEYSSNRRW